MSEPLLVVDLQLGFINEFTQHIPGRIKSQIQTGDYAPILFTSRQMIRLLALRGDALDARMGVGPYAEELGSGPRFA